MPELLCPFAAPLVKKDFGCKYADEVIRRGGSEIACKQMASHTLCTQLHNQMKLAALSAMDLEDDLLSVPHSVLVKIQYGGLLGLQTLTHPELMESNKVADVESLLVDSEKKFNHISNIPLESISEAIIDFKMQRRRKK